MATWAVFAVADEAKKITVFNTHLDYESARAQELSAKLICDRMGKIDAEFGRHLANGVQLLDALSGVDLDQRMTFHDFTGKAFDAVDTIYQNEGVWGSYKTHAVISDGRVGYMDSPR